MHPPSPVFLRLSSVPPRLRPRSSGQPSQAPGQKDLSRRRSRQLSASEEAGRARPPGQAGCRLRAPAARPEKSHGASQSRAQSRPNWPPAQTAGSRPSWRPNLSQALKAVLACEACEACGSRNRDSGTRTMHPCSRREARPEVARDGGGGSQSLRSVRVLRAQGSGHRKSQQSPHLALAEMHRSFVLKGGTRWLPALPPGCARGI